MIKLPTGEVKRLLGAMPASQFGRNWKMVTTPDNYEAIQRDFKFPTFEDAWAFLTKIAMRSHRKGHHPTITNEYNKVVLELTTHDVKGVSDLDIKLAKRFDKYAHTIGETD